MPEAPAFWSRTPKKSKPGVGPPVMKSVMWVKSPGRGTSRHADVTVKSPAPSVTDTVLETSLTATQAESLAAWRGLPEGITADDRPGAEAIVEQIRKDLAQAEQPAS